MFVVSPASCSFRFAHALCLLILFHSQAPCFSGGRVHRQPSFPCLLASPVPARAGSGECSATLDCVPRPLSHLPPLSCLPMSPPQIFNFAMSNSFTSVDFDRLEFPSQYKVGRPARLWHCRPAAALLRLACRGSPLSRGGAPGHGRSWRGPASCWSRGAVAAGRLTCPRHSAPHACSNPSPHPTFTPLHCTPPTDRLRAAVPGPRGHQPGLLAARHAHGAVHRVVRPCCLLSLFALHVSCLPPSASFWNTGRQLAYALRLPCASPTASGSHGPPAPPRSRPPPAPCPLPIPTPQQPRHVRDHRPRPGAGAPGVRAAAQLPRRSGLRVPWRRPCAGGPAACLLLWRATWGMLACRGWSLLLLLRRRLGRGPMVCFPVGVRQPNTCLQHPAGCCCVTAAALLACPPRPLQNGQPVKFENVATPQECCQVRGGGTNGGLPGIAMQRSRGHCAAAPLAAERAHPAGSPLHGCAPSPRRSCAPPTPRAALTCGTPTSRSSASSRWAAAHGKAAGCAAGAAHSAPHIAPHQCPLASLAPAHAMPSTPLPSARLPPAEPQGLDAHQDAEAVRGDLLRGGARPWQPGAARQRRPPAPALGGGAAAARRLGRGLGGGGGAGGAAAPLIAAHARPSC